MIEGGADPFPPVVRVGPVQLAAELLESLHAVLDPGGTDPASMAAAWARFRDVLSLVMELDVWHRFSVRLLEASACAALEYVDTVDPATASTNERIGVAFMVRIFPAMVVEARKRGRLDWDWMREIIQARSGEAFAAAAAGPFAARTTTKGQA